MPHVLVCVGGDGEDGDHTEQAEGDAEIEPDDGALGLDVVVSLGHEGPEVDEVRLLIFFQSVVSRLFLLF